MKDFKKRYEELFPDNITKAEAFDKIAAEYYYCNFGAMQKSDFDTLMFSIYLERILENSESDYNTYSDYELSKYLGITQTKVSNLKVKKELKYPYKKFDWKISFVRILGNARVEDNKIVIPIHDINLYIEIKNAIESKGNFIEQTLNSKVMKISTEYFFDLVLELCGEDEKENVRNELCKKLSEEKKLNDSFFETKESIGGQLKKAGITVSMDILSNVLSAIPVVGPFIGNPIGEILKKLLIKD